MNDTKTTPPTAQAEGSDLDRWRISTRHIWSKHRRATRLMMRWMYVSGRKARLRFKKWSTQYARTLNRVPMPPNAEPSDRGTNV
jgi:hypothetical protein